MKTTLTFTKITFFIFFIFFIFSSGHLYAQTQLGADLDAEASWNYFGASVSLSQDGNRLAVGANNNSGNGNQSGHVRIFDYNGSDWVQVGTDIDGEAAGDNFGVAVSISADGSRLAAGGSYNDATGTDAGHVRVFDYNGTDWVQVGQDIDGEAAGDFFGGDISLSSNGNRVAIGAIHNGGNGTSAGHTRIYEYNGSSWVKLGQDIDGEAAFDYCGHSVALSSNGGRVAVGAIFNDGNGSSSGHVRLYDYNGSSWVQVGQDINGEAAGDRTGESVSLSDDGTRVAIGAYSNAGNGTNSGHVRIFDYNGTSWVQVGQDIDGEAAYDYSGGAVSLSSSGSRVAIGATNNSGNGSLSGHVRIYDFDGTNWVLDYQDIDGEASNDRSGDAVALSADGSRVAIGAPWNTGNGTNAGHTRVYDLTIFSNWSMGGNGNWNSGSNWSSGQVPNASTASTIDGNVSVTISGSAQALSITLANGADLVVNGDLTVPPENDIEIPASSKVSGSGTVNGDVVNNGGNICMGNSPGVLSVVGDVNLTSGTTDVEINGTTSGTEYDVLNVSGALTIGAAANLNITFGGGFLPAENDEFDIITANSISGTFDLANISFSGGNVADISISYLSNTTIRVTVNSIILPVEMVFFNANLKNQKAELRWQTLSETQNKGFAIQRSKDLKSWQEIAYVEGVGTTHQISNYQWVDHRPLKGQSYYRLQQQDYDGGIAYSRIQSILLNPDDFRVFPNPFTDTINLINGKGELCIFNAFGQLVTQLQVNEEQQIIDLSYLPKGSYLIKIKRPNGVGLSQLIMK